MLRIISWSSLAKVQNIRAVKSMYIWLFVVPIVAKALSKAEGVANVRIFDYEFAFQLGLPFSWKVFYFCALFFTVANLIFVGRCYSIIKDHRSYGHFKEEGKVKQQLLDYATEAGIDVEIRPHVMDEHQERFWDVYEGANFGRTSMRLICGTFYLIGFILIGVIVYQNLLVVLQMSF